MEVVESIRHLLWGVLQVEQEIIKRVRARRVLLTAADFSWNGGRSLFTGPLGQIIHMEVRAGRRHFSTQWPRAHLQDSKDRIERPEVLEIIACIVQTLAP
jgi:hypothetical protein